MANDSITLTYAVFIADGQRITPSIVRSACTRLQVDLVAFGLTLD